MINHFALIGGATIGMAMGAVSIPFTRRALAAAITRASVEESQPKGAAVRWQLVTMIVASGALPGAIFARVGWSIVAIPPLVMFLGLVQLAYCDLKRHLLPKTMVWVTTAAVLLSTVCVTAAIDGWHRMLVAILCGAALFALLFVINLMNPAWMAYGDVRLAPVVGLGLGWISPMALLEGFFLANFLAAVVGVVMIVTQKAGRKAALPFGFYLAAAAGVVMLAWS